MIDKLIEDIPASQIVQWVIIAGVVVVVCLPKLKAWAKTWVKNDGENINERMDEIDKEIVKMKGKLDNDFRRLTILEEAIATRIRNEKKSQHELYLLMRSNLILLDSVDSEEAEKCRDEMNQYVLKEFHNTEEEDDYGK